MRFDKKSISKLVLFSAAGAGLGYAYYYYVGCVSGTCPITSDPLVSTIYGSIMGIFLGFPNKKKEPKNN